MSGASAHERLSTAGQASTSFSEWKPQFACAATSCDRRGRPTGDQVCCANLDANCAALSAIRPTTDRPDHAPATVLGRIAAEGCEFQTPGPSRGMVEEAGFEPATPLVPNQGSPEHQFGRVGRRFRHQPKTT